MKLIDWEPCTGSGASGGQKPCVYIKGMHVSAKYVGLDVHLRITDLVNPHSFVAVVLFFEPPASEKKPDDLRQGDQVNINSGDICWTFDD